jgi:cobalamin synthase
MILIYNINVTILEAIVPENTNIFLAVLLVGVVLASLLSSFLRGRAASEGSRRKAFFQKRSNFWLIIALIGLAIAVFRW